MTDILNPPTGSTESGTAVKAGKRPVRSVPKRRLPKLLKHFLLITAGIVMLYPVLWMIVSSLRSNDQIFNDPGLVLTNPQWDNYSNGWTALEHPFGHYMINSAIVVLGCVVGNLFSCSMAAYAFARLQFKGKSGFFAIMLLTPPHRAFAQPPRRHPSATAPRPPRRPAAESARGDVRHHGMRPGLGRSPR